jgi:uncharacterized protein YbbC (DUF1343 family)
MSDPDQPSVLVCIDPPATPEMLANLDALLFDIRRRFRYYTYAWTMRGVQPRAAAFVTGQLAIGGELVQGDVLDTAFMTSSAARGAHAARADSRQLAGLLNGELGGARLTVIPVKLASQPVVRRPGLLGRLRPTCPLELATLPGTCLFEAPTCQWTRHRGRLPAIGATWLDSDALVGRLRAQHIPGSRPCACRTSPGR